MKTRTVDGKLGDTDMMKVWDCKIEIMLDDEAFSLAVGNLVFGVPIEEVRKALKEAKDENNRVDFWFLIILVLVVISAIGIRCCIATSDLPDMVKWLLLK